MNKIIVFVGASGTGKSTLMLELVHHLSDRLTIIKSMTSRKRRGMEDDPFYQFVSLEEIKNRQSQGRLLQVSEYAGQLYANDKIDLDLLLNNKIGLISLIPSAIENFRQQGYDLMTIKVIPADNYYQADARLIAEDAKHDIINYRADFEIINSFKPAGKEATIRRLIELIHQKLI